MLIRNCSLNFFPQSTKNHSLVLEEVIKFIAQAGPLVEELGRGKKILIQREIYLV